MQEFDPTLLHSMESNNTRQHGSYNPIRFIIRLSPQIHNVLKDIEDDAHAKGALNFKQIQAFSTFMHENIHWWQHVGSNFGFLSSLSYPVGAHLAYADLNTMIAKGEKYKPIISYDEMWFTKENKHDNPEINRLLNNCMDLIYAKQYAHSHENIRTILKDKRFFLNIGHCYHILWSATVNAIAELFDPQNTYMPDSNKWLSEFERLEKEEVEGFYIDSPVGISPLGTHAIYEGQARINQLQYLTIASGNTMIYDDFSVLGMCGEIYMEAYESFFELSKIEMPDNFNNSLVGLFLLVCEIAINPVDGFPFDVYHFETFIISNDPGLRFVMLCQAIGKDINKWSNAVTEYTREEYAMLSIELCKEIVCFAPIHGTVKVKEWIASEQALQELLQEETACSYRPENMAVRMFFAKYLRFQEDKFKTPQLFCWIGKCMTNELPADLQAEQVLEVFNRQRALFIDDVDGDIYPMIFDNYTEDDLLKTFNEFFVYNTTYDMIYKWIFEKGDFTFEYNWLTSKYSEEETTNWIRNNFKKLFNIYPEDIEVLE